MARSTDRKVSSPLTCQFCLLEQFGGTMNKYYVYVHLNSRGNVIYVGKGSGKRCYTFKKSKSKNYLSELEKEGGKFDVLKVAENLTYEEATDLEIQTYEKYVVEGNLLNGRKPSKVKVIDVSEILSKVRYDESSPTMLRWICKGRNIQEGAVAGSKHSAGYYEVRINTELYLVHRVVWVIHGNTLDSNMVIDHIDGDRKNNKISNLRQISNLHNSHNSSVKSNNKTGYVGVSFSKSRNRYVACCQIDHKCYKNQFSCNVHGTEVALQMAIKWRADMLKMLNENGAAYTERHQNL